jgi:Peptidylarginine deiminase and related enzymes
LLVLAPPIKLNEYYKERYYSVIPFYKRYVEKIQEGSDQVVVVVDKETMEDYRDQIDSKVLLKNHIDDPWTRDVSTPIPSIDVQFTYVGGSNLAEATNTQTIFNKFIRGLGIRPKKTDLLLDGGNLVNNNADKVITTRKFLTDNNLSEEEGVEALQEELGVEKVSILTQDEPKLGHSDGMAAYVCENTIYMHKQPEKEFHELVKEELWKGCEDCEIVEVEGYLDDREFKEGYASSCGVYVNCVVTNNYIYVPQFGREEYDKPALELFRQNPCGKKVVPIDVKEVCLMGGSLRCLSWQTEGRYAAILRKAAIDDDANEGSGSGSGMEVDGSEEEQKREVQEKLDRVMSGLKKFETAFRKLKKQVAEK